MKGLLTAAGLFPHPPIMVPEIGGKETKKIQQTMDAVRKSMKLIMETDPETVVVMSPHNLCPPSGPAIFIKENLAGDLMYFGHPEVSMEFSVDQELAEAVMKEAEPVIPLFRMDEAAAKKIYAAKGRPSDNPLIAHVSCLEEIAPLVSNMPENGKKLAKAYWPGPMTMVFPKSAIVPYGTTGGLDTVAIRMPSDPIAAELIRLSGVPIAAPSANTSGRPSPTRADHVLQDMDGKIDAIIDGGPVGIGLESTIVDVTEEMPMVLRPGAITVEMLRETVGEVGIDPAILGPVSADVRPKAPGMKYRHYAPKADLTLVEGGTEAVVETINRLAGEKLAEGRKVGIICTDETKDRYPAGML